MARLLGLDVGEKTIGTAMSDENGVMAFPRDTILRKEGWRQDMAVLRELVKGNQIRTIVVGLPLMMDGNPGIQAAKVEAFVSVLRRNVRVPIVLQDERLSTREANRVLMQADLNRDERKRVVDSVAACILLQAFIDKRAIIDKQAITDNRNAAGVENHPNNRLVDDMAELAEQAIRPTGAGCKMEPDCLDLDEAAG